MADTLRECWQQPTQDRLFLAGYAFGLYRDRVFLVRSGQVRSLSDIAGRFIYDFDRLRLISNLSDRQWLRLDNSPGRREDFIRRLRTVGCAVDFKGKPWHCKGNFYFAYKD